jgi:hypothetical protein
MKTIKLTFGTFVLTMILIITFAGCPEPDTEPTYTVWTDTASSSEFSSAFGTLNDGYYRRIILTNAEFNSMTLPNENKKTWTENQIYNWFLGRDFTSSEAETLKAWVITNDHCFIASRSGNIVYILVK